MRPGLRIRGCEYVRDATALTAVASYSASKYHQPKPCNGTRFAVKKLMINVVEATSLTGLLKGEGVLISRSPMIPMEMPFLFKRLQFPIRLTFAFTINKAQGQPLKLIWRPIAFHMDNYMLRVLE
ncbi:unnamed protein product [Onchocerca ochengi]|uniref:ATP-dependent DNA helicase n=1 Tax=Onchocerca ochengi TaxID=42157 RepID=A0A182ERP4_ONCOC|nr:unnamed protein product [Onchocerca ochengi]